MQLVAGALLPGSGRNSTYTGCAVFPSQLYVHSKGVDLPDLDSAKREALRTAREMMNEKIALGRPVADQVFGVCDEFGVLLFKLAFKDVLHS